MSFSAFCASAATPWEAGVDLKRLIVTADDFGLDAAVNDAVERAHRDGILTAASLMVGAAGASGAVSIARRMPSLRVGLHVTLLEARPVLPRTDIPLLVDETGDFRTDMVRFALEIFIRPAVRRQIQAEVEAQFQAFAATGLRLDHVNAHKHFHIHPSVAAILVPIAKKYGAPFLRVPAESGQLVVEIDPLRSTKAAAGLAPWSALLKARANRAGLATPDHVFGLAWSGALTKSRLLALVTRLPDGVSEIYSHPATRSDFPGAAPGYRYLDELAALTDADVMAALTGIRRSGFGDIGGP